MQSANFSKESDQGLPLVRWQRKQRAVPPALVALCCGGAGGNRINRRGGNDGIT